MEKELLIKTIQGYCSYCKDEILLSEDYAVSDGKLYHIGSDQNGLDCYHLVKERDG